MDHKVMYERQHDNHEAAAVASLMVQLYSAIIAAQAWMIWNARKIDSGQVKRTFVQAYFACFTASSVALCVAHLQDTGHMAFNVAGATLLIVTILLAIAYG